MFGIIKTLAGETNIIARAHIGRYRHMADFGLIKGTKRAHMGTIFALYKPYVDPVCPILTLCKP